MILVMTPPSKDGPFRVKIMISEDLCLLLDSRQDEELSSAIGMMASGS
jgi:hypothetical protein